MDGWLAKVNADHRSIPRATKIIEDKPDTVADRCTDGNGNDVPFASCEEVVQQYGTPRFGAMSPRPTTCSSASSSRWTGPTTR